MKLKSAAGIVCYVKDLTKTVKFYKSLGFTFKKNKPTHATGYINWFWIDFLRSDKEDKPRFRDEANSKNKGRVSFSISALTTLMKRTRVSLPRGSSRQANRKIGPEAIVNSLFAILTAITLSSSNGSNQ